VREASIRLRFPFEGKFYRKTITLNGEPIKPTAANVKYAHRLAEEIRGKINHDQFSMAEYFPASGEGAVLTVASQLDTWLNAKRIADSTKAGYASAVNFWKNNLGDLALRRLVASKVMTATAAHPELSGKTVNNYMSVLREAIQLAVADRLIPDNPVASIGAAAYQKEPPDPFSRIEADKIVADLVAKQDPQIGNFVEFWFWTGMRTGEIFGLQWANVDLASGQVLVSESVVRGKRKASTKTNVARTVLLNSRALAALQRQRKHTQLGGTDVFHDPRYGQAWVDERAFRRSYWTPTLKRLGIRYRRPYNMRHTYATAMLMAGMNAAFCARQMGHSIEMFHKTYARWMDGDQNAAEMARLEKSFSALELPQPGIEKR
jgi:integrase